jgi:mannose-6-phosphate isomerase-like protein (cupin superfamily)
MNEWTLHPEDGLARLPGPPTAIYPQGARSVAMLRHGSLEVRLFHPKDRDLQQPHTRDELYVVVAGAGRFDNGGVVLPCKAGDAIFVPAQREHRFVEFSSDFVAWVMFYGPEGGEPA